MRTKQIKYEQVKHHPLVTHRPYGREVSTDFWKNFFGNDHALVIEIACGRGEYTTGLASHYPDRNFIGLDIKGERLRHGAHRAEELGLCNVGFARGLVQQLGSICVPNTVAEIWIVHPDPRPKGSDEHKRLTHQRFLALYEQALMPDGIVRLQTDNDELFAWSIEHIAEYGRKLGGSTTDLYQSAFLDHHHGIQTCFEQRYLEQGETINYAWWVVS